MAFRQSIEEREFHKRLAPFKGFDGMEMIDDSFIKDDNGYPVFYGPPENEYGLWREDQLDVLINKCTVNPFVPLGEKVCVGVVSSTLYCFTLLHTMLFLKKCCMCAHDYLILCVIIHMHDRDSCKCCKCAHGYLICV